MNYSVSKKIFGLALIAMLVIAFQNCDKGAPSLNNQGPDGTSTLGGSTTIIGNPLTTTSANLRFASFTAAARFSADICVTNIKFGIAQSGGALAQPLIGAGVKLPIGKSNAGFDLTYFYQDPMSQDYLLSGLHFENPIHLSSLGTDLGTYILPTGQYNQVVIGLSSCQTSLAPGLRIQNSNGTFADEAGQTIELVYNSPRIFTDGKIQEFDISNLINSIQNVTSNSELLSVLSGYRRFSLIGFTSSAPHSSGLATLRKVVGQADGKTVAAGLLNTGGYQYAVAARYNVDGSLDSSFASTAERPGMAVQFLNLSYGVNGVAISPVDGAIYVVADTYNDGTGLYDLAVVKFDSNGNVVTGFGKQGVFSVNIGNLNNHSADIVAEPNGEILAVGESDGHMIMAMIKPTGLLDASFGQGGTTSYPLAIYDYGYKVSAVLQPDQKILVAAHHNHGPDVFWQISRFLPTGAIDSSFNSAGANPGNVLLSFGDTRFAVTTGINLQSDGKILVVGYDSAIAAGDDSEDFLVLRLNSDGAFDSTFGNQASAPGLFRYSMPGSQQASGVLQLPNGDIVVSGVATTTVNYAYMLLTLPAASLSTPLTPQFYLANSGAQGGYLYYSSANRLVIGGSYDRYFDLLNVR